MTTKAPPSKRFTPIGSAFKVAGAPLTAHLVTALADNRQHALEVLLDPDVHVAAVNHLHSGVDSAHLDGNPDTPNLIRQGVINDAIASIWGTSNPVSWLLNPKSGDNASSAADVTITSRGLQFSNAPSWATHIIGDLDGPPASMTILGQGSDVVASVYLYAPTAPTSGQMEFGLTLGGKGKDDDSKTFAEGCRIVVPWQLMRQGWTRFWAVLDDVGGQFDDSVRYCVQCTESANVAITANLSDVRPGRVLDWWTPGYNSDSYSGWRGYGMTGTPPPLDQVLAFDDAVRLWAT